MKYFLIALVFFNFSCKKERSCEKCVGDSIIKNATIIYSGPVEGDGCSWLVKLDDAHSYHADVLDTAFQHDQLNVKVSYQLTSEKFICGIAAMEIPVIHVVKIEK
ncbi:MAG TPA: hypothetical protein VGP55_04620 [Chitinophagaceae bacterium]|nr:hypothetical protein [Chitinophagaceae bacterium]